MDEENSEVLVQKKDSPSSSLIQKPAKKRKVGGKLDTDEREYLDSLLALWFGVSVPLNFVGAYFGFKKRVGNQLLPLPFKII